MQADLASGAAEAAFQEDLAECRRYGVTGFPTFLFRRESPVSLPGADRPVLVVGHRSFATFRQVLHQLAPDLEEHPARDVPTVLSAYGPLTTRELAEVYRQPLEAMRQHLLALAAEGRVQKRPVRGGEFWAT